MDYRPREEPTTLWEYLKMLARETVISILKRARLMILLAVTVWILHTYLLVGPNGGFLPADNPFLQSVLALHGRQFSGMMFWALLCGLAAAVFVRVREDGPEAIRSNIKESLRWVGKVHKELGRSARPFLLLGSAVGLLLGTAIDNRLVSLELSVLAGGALLAHYGSELSLVIRLAWSDAQRLVRHRQQVKLLSRPLAEIILAGGTLGFFVAFVLPLAYVLGYILSAILFLLVWLALRRGGGGARHAPTTAIFVIGISGILASLVMKAAFGDDGGWDEAGGTLPGWVHSSGAVPAVLYGILPAIGSAIGLGVGLAVGHLPGQRLHRQREEEEARKPIVCPIYHGGIGDNRLTAFHAGVGPDRSDLSGLPNYWINTSTLNLVVQHTVFTYTGLGPRVSLTQTYNAVCQAGGMFGRGWQFNYESTIQQTGDSIYLWKGSGQRVDYRLGDASAPAGPDHPIEAQPVGSEYDKLLDYGSYWIFSEKATRLKYRYDKLPQSANAILQSISDHNENTLTIDYGEDGTMSGITDAAGRRVTFEHDSNKLCTSINLPDGRSAKYEYDKTGHLIRVVNLVGTAVAYQYDSDDLLTRISAGKDLHGIRFTYQGTEEGMVIESVTDSQENAARYEMVELTPRQVKVTDPEGAVTTYFSTNGMTEKVVDALGNRSETTFSNNLPVTVKDKNGATTEFAYDSHGNPTKVANALDATSTFAYDANDNLVSETNPAGEKTSYSYDAKGNLTNVTLSSGRSITLEYDTKGQPSTLRRAVESVFALKYDRFGNLIEMTDPLGHSFKLSYDPFGLMYISVTDARGNTTNLEYDANGRLTKVINPDSSARTYTYDCCAVTSTVDENGNPTTFARDARSAIKMVEDPIKNSMLLYYDRDRRIIKVSDPMDHNANFSYDPLGRMVQAFEAEDSPYRLGYDPEGNLTDLWNQLGKHSSCAYDVVGHTTKETDPLGHSAEFTWDAVGRLAAKTNARGGKVNYSYYPDGLVAGISFDGTRSAYEYDASGNLIKMTDTTGTTAFQYDAANQVTSIKYPDDLEVSLSYDEMGNISRIVYPGGMAADYSYDTRNRVTKVSWGENWIAYNYDAVGNITMETRSNGTETALTYDADNRLVEMKHEKGSYVIARRDYKRDANGNIIAESGILPIKPVVLDEDIITTYNDADQITSRSADEYNYDADGNLTSISDTKWQALYDDDDRLVELVRDGKTSHYTYNGRNQRVRTDTGSFGRNFHHDPSGRLLFETNDSGGIIVYIYSTRILAARIKAGETEFYHFDKTGNTLAITDRRGEVIAAYAYAPFGAVTNKSGIDENPFTYVGEFGVMDEGGGIFFMKRRYYDAVTGRFVQKDPAGIRSATNLYAYASNNPVTNIDPEGTQGGTPRSIVCHCATSSSAGMLSF